ncbi:MAG: ATP-binding protein [Limnothrix sp.]
MKLSSFRLRIALFSALLAGVTVTGFGGISYVLLYQSKLDSLDQNIQEKLLREASIPRPIMYWEIFEESRAFAFSSASKSNAALLILNQNQTIYQSQNWPTQLNSQASFLPQPEVKDLNLRDFPSVPPPPNIRRRENNDFRQRPNPEELRRLTQLSDLVTHTADQKKWRLGTVSSPFVQMAIAVDLQIIDQEMAVIRNIFFLMLPITLLLVTVGAWWLSSDALKAIQNLTEIIRQVTAKGLNQRASSAKLDIEFVELVNVFNQMMARLERSFQQASRFSADAAHELKTPLAILQGELERAVQKTSAGSEQQQTFSRLLDEVRRLSSITRKLLLLSLADAGQMQIQKTTVDLSEIIRDLAEDIDLIAPELRLDLKLLPKLIVSGDQDLLAQILQNLITNAIKYNLPNGWIRINTQQQNGILFVKISNVSRDISAGDRRRIFDRFQRGDASRNRQVEGFGLGLSLSREIARAHGGELQLEPASPNCTTFTLSLPLAGTV